MTQAMEEARKMERELYARRRKAEDVYLELRDAKSDGCCYGFSIAEVLQYDAKIDKAAQELNKRNDEYLKAARLVASLVEGVTA